jgi:protein-L-isoaspartate(D-aspartate) O-methyltransferase
MDARARPGAARTRQQRNTERHARRLVFLASGANPCGATMLDLAHARDRMVDTQIARRGVRDHHVLEAMRRVPREQFVSPELAEFAYEDAALPIEAGQTISQPYIVALMIEAAQVKPGDRVLEIGGGSGYAAAVLSMIANQVYAIERHPELAATARRRFEQLGYDNIELRTGDGTYGWPEAQPFDAILVAAAGPRVPEPLLMQLAVRGRLVMPVGDSQSQRLVRVTRVSETEYNTEDLGEVTFVPLIGAHGWTEDGRTDQRGAAPVPSGQDVRDLSGLIHAAAEPLPEIDDPGFGRLFDRFAGATVVLLGEASHGTSEFYRARAAISRRLIEAHGFRIVAVEADWPDAAKIDAYVRHKAAREGAAFQRFPTWMWRNTDVDAFVRWLRRYNAGLAPERRTGFYGLDLYNLSGSIQAVIQYLDRVDPQAAKVARERYGCLTPWQNEPQTYGRMAVTSGYAACEAPVVKMLRDLLKQELSYAAKDSEGFLDAAQNARLIRDAERYYRAMYFGAAESWNLRDRHMFETLEHLLQAKGAGSKAIVWAHNSHIGNAAFTEMGIVREEINVGQLCRERWSRDAALIGFGTHTGTVAAASDWDAPMQVMHVKPSLPDSCERLAHDTTAAKFLLDLRPGQHDAVRERLLQPRLQRFIGVIYRPDTERWSHYAEVSMPEQFDAYVWFDETHAVTPLPTPQQPGPEETYPFGL